MRGTFFTLLAGIGWTCSSLFASEVIPVRGLLYTPEEIRAVRKQATENPRFKAIARRFLSTGEQWVALPEAEIERLIPPPEAKFARGFAGDPVSNQPWPEPGDRLCSLARPFEVVSPIDKAIYGIQKPGELFHDDGNGWVRPADGKVFYFRGIWNAFVVRKLHEAVDALSVSYLLTGNEAFAGRALVILDRLATLRSKRPSVDTFADWPAKVEPHHGFFFYEGNLANDRMYISALAFDLVGRASAASLPSSGDAALTRFENIRQNYFSVLEPKRLRGGSFHNHTIAAHVSALSQGLLFGSPDAIRQGIEITYGFLDNTMDRDGEYYEESAMYDRLGRGYGGRLIVLLGHYTPVNYADPARFPNPGEYPYHLRFGDDPAWFNAAIRSMYSLSTLSRFSQYGDAPADRFTNSTDPDPQNRKAAFLKLFYHQTSNLGWKSLCQKLYWSLSETEREREGALYESILRWGPSQWMPPPRPQNLDLPPDFRQEASVVAGQKRIAILRSGTGEYQRAVFMRGGAGNLHGHDDQMGIVLYGEGLSLTGEYGYKHWGTPDHAGYGTKPVAHQTVVVDEAPARAFDVSYPPYPAARIEGYQPFGPAQFIEMANPALWPESDLREYRRQTWLVDLSEKSGYFVDFFQVSGGRIHDYVRTAPYLQPPQAGSLTFDGVEPAPREGVWSLAGLNAKHRGALFNQPGKSWGERLDLGSGTIRNLGIPGEQLPTTKWDPPPQNGYGFIWNLQSAETEQDWSATWRLHDGQHSLRMTMLATAPQTVLTGKAPSLGFGSPHEVVIVRRESTDGTPLQSLFATVTQTAAGGAWPLKQIKATPGLTPGEGGVEVTHQDGTRDLLLAFHKGDGRRAHSSLRLEGKNAFLRRTPDGTPAVILLSQGTTFEAADFSLRLPRNGWSARVTQATARRIALDRPLPAVGQLEGYPALFDSPADAVQPYSSNEFFALETVDTGPNGNAILTFDRQNARAGRLKITGKRSSGAITTLWPNESAAVPIPMRHPARVFEGHLLQEEGAPPAPQGPHAILTRYLGKSEFTAEPASAIEAGKTYELMAVAPGDHLYIPSFALLELQTGGSWKLRANSDVEIRLDREGSRVWHLESNGVKTKLEADAAGTLRIPVALLKGGTGVITPRPDSKGVEP